MDNNFPPNMNPQLYSFIAVAIGYACIGTYNVNEQNSIGNWLILVGQFILTNAAQQQVIESRNKGKIFQSENNNEIELLINAIKKIENELERIKKENNLN